MAPTSKKCADSPSDAASWQFYSVRGRSPPALELTRSDTLQSFWLAPDGATSGCFQGYCLDCRRPRWQPEVLTLQPTSNLVATKANDCSSSARRVTADSYKPVGLLQSCLMPSCGLSSFAFSKRTLVTSHLRLQVAIRMEATNGRSTPSAVVGPVFRKARPPTPWLWGAPRRLVGHSPMDLDDWRSVHACCPRTFVLSTGDLCSVARSM